jgi:hypothetical protein
MAQRWEHAISGNSGDKPSLKKATEKKIEQRHRGVRSTSVAFSASALG